MEPLLVELPLVGLRLELEEPELVSGRGRVDVPGRVVVPGRDVSGRVDVLGRDVPGRVVDEPGLGKADFRFSGMALLSW